MKSLHKEDLVVDGQTMRQQMIENFKDIEDEDVHDHKDFNQEVQNRKRADKGLQSQIDKLNTRCKKLENSRTTHDDLNKMRSDLQKRINHLYAGDPRTIKTVVAEILEEKGVI